MQNVGPGAPRVAAEHRVLEQFGGTCRGRWAAQPAQGDHVETTGFERGEQRARIAPDAALRELWVLEDARVDRSARHTDPASASCKASATFAATTSAWKSVALSRAAAAVDPARGSSRCSASVSPCTSPAMTS